MRRLAPALTLLISLVFAAGAEAASVSVAGGELRVIGAPGESNQVTIAPSAADPAALEVTDGVASPVTVSGATSVYADLADGDDSLSLTASLPARILGGTENDTLTVAPSVLVLDPALAPAVTLDGGDGDDILTGAGGPDALLGLEGDDTLSGAAGNDTLDAAGGSDSADGGPGADSLVLLDKLADTAWCGTGRDRVRAEELDQLDFACERVDYGPPGRVGRLRARTGRGKFVVIPGMPWASIDRRVLPNLLYLVRRYHVRVGDGYAPYGHEPRGEHPLGLAVDLYPGPGGSWRDVGRLARWAEPRQNRPRPPWRWVGWNGDENHGHPRVCKISRGCPPHLHLSWAHSPGRPRRPVRTVWVFDVRTAPRLTSALFPAGDRAGAGRQDL